MKNDEVLHIYNKSADHPVFSWADYGYWKQNTLIGSV